MVNVLRKSSWLLACLFVLMAAAFSSSVSAQTSSASGVSRPVGDAYPVGSRLPQSLSGIAAPAPAPRAVHGLAAPASVSNVAIISADGRKDPVCSATSVFEFRLQFNGWLIFDSSGYVVATNTDPHGWGIGDISPTVKTVSTLLQPRCYKITCPQDPTASPPGTYSFVLFDGVDVASIQHRGSFTTMAVSRPYICWEADPVAANTSPTVTFHVHLSNSVQGVFVDELYPNTTQQKETQQAGGQDFDYTGTYPYSVNGGAYDLTVKFYQASGDSPAQNKVLPGGTTKVDCSYSNGWPSSFHAPNQDDWSILRGGTCIANTASGEGAGTTAGWSVTLHALNPGSYPSSGYCDVSCPKDVPAGTNYFVQYRSGSAGGYLGQFTVLSGQQTKGPFLIGTTIPMPPTCAAQSYGGPANPGQPGPPGHGAGSGPTDGAGDDPVNLATGVDTYHQAPDISVYNSTGVSASFQRTAYSNLALSGNAAPGLSTGWSHNYNVQILGVGQTATWLPVTLIYADGVTEQLTPVLDASGNPTGAFTPPAGSPFIVRGVASGTTGVWSSITLTWDDQTQWAFNGGTTTANGISVYPLTQITNRVGQALLLAWDGYRKLQSVTDRATGRTLLSFTYDGAGYLSSVTDPINGASARQVNYTFGNDSASGATVLKSVSQVTTVGNTSAPARATYGYVAGPGTNTGGHLPLLSTVTVPSPTGVGNTTDTVAYDSGFRVKSYTDMNGFQHLYTYNKGNTFVQLRDGNGVAAVTWTTRFDTLNRINGVKDAAGNNTSIGYADLGNPLQPTIISDKNLHAYQYTYDAFGHPVKIKDPRGVETTFTWAYNQFALGRLQKVQVGTNQGTPRTPTTFAYYEPSGLVQTITGPAPNSSAGGATVVQASMTYDPLGDLLTLRHPGNNATVSGGTDQGVTLTFNYANDPQVTVTDAQNVARTIPGASQPAASVGHPLSIQNSATGQISHLRYGARGLLQTTYDALGHEGDLTYNLADQVTSVILPHTGQTSQDGLGQARVVTTYQYPGGPAASQQVFDESGASTPFRQAVSHYGPEGEIISITATDNTTLATYAYDAAYRLKTLTDGGGHVTRYYYNPVGYLSAILYPGGDTFQIPSYDPAGNALQAIDGRGVVTNYVYSDPASALTDVKYPATPAKNVHYDYDVYGRLIDTTDGGYGAFNADGTVKTVGKAFSYYENGQFSSAQVALRKPDGTTLPAKTLSAVYWPDGSLQTMTTPAGVFSYNYDGAGRLLNLTNPFSEQTAWQYQANGWPLQTAFANGVKAGYQFNPIGQILGLTYKNSAGTTIADLSIPAFGGYDGAGNRLSQTVTIPAAGLPAGYSGPATYFSGTTNYQYDPRNQLLLESSSRLGSSPLTTNYSYGYGYDSAGNPTKFRNVTVGGVGFNANNQSTASGFAFDAAGNPVSYFGLPLAFDAENHLLTTGH